MGQTKEPTGDELRQTVAEHTTVLQEGHNEEDGEEPEAGVPVLPPVLPVNPS